ncbi:unnamed protein product [Mytilus edulis]|uniref:C-type lectin domain-containing protein n=1 Tax=Mytilus edulis TaxID=6550 RepID=A0A8S3QUT0_MYTED|nr:unnamed protein product [Mytilus edulis]
MDVAVEDTWTHLDGTSIANNDFWSTFWVDAVSTNTQPNGGSGQNCAVINSRNVPFPNKTQDKLCLNYPKDEMLCYKKVVNCLNWTSSADQMYREHCYWFTSKPLSISSWTIVDAMVKCQEDGGYIASLIDDQNYQFIKNDVLGTVFSLKSTQVWLGTHSIIGSPSNWNNDPAFVSLLSPSSSSEKCVVIDSNQIQSWIPCNTNSSALTGAVCFKHGLENSGDDEVTKRFNISASARGETFIGVMDVAIEDTWTHLDGSSIANNDFWSTFWVDADLRLNQPNGGTGQNCAVINKRSFRLPNKTQDKSCTNVFRDEMLCYKKVNCLKWNSSADQQYREHCYWFTSKPSSLTSWTIVDAINKCREDGGYLAPLIDDLNYQFIRDDVLSTVFS